MDQKYVLQTVCKAGHKLISDNRETVFTCEGCKEKGNGVRRRCPTCDVDLHTFCAECGCTTFYHPFHNHGFQFLEKPPGDKPRFCDGCGNDVLGFVYHCQSCGFDLHPTCAHLPETLPINFDGQDCNHTLRLCPQLSSCCYMCHKRGLGWAYKCDCRKYKLHVSCAKQIVSSCLPVAGIPSAIAPLHAPRHISRRRRRVRKICSMALSAIRVIIALILGDPTTLIVELTAALISDYVHG